MRLSFLTFFLFFFSIQSFSSGLEGFEKRFKIIRSADGKLQTVRVKGAMASLGLGQYIQSVKNDLLDLKASIFAPSYLKSAQENAQLTRNRVDSIIEQMELDSIVISEKMYTDEQPSSYVRRALLNLKSVDLNSAFEQMRAKGIFQNLKNLLVSFYEQRQMDIIAKPYERRFFYQQKATNKVIELGIDFAKKRLSGMPILDVARFIITDVITRLEEQREIAQNMLLYYVINYEKEIGLTMEETNFLVSSIYESRIGLFGLIEANNAVKTWESYGWNSFDSLLRTANNKMRLLEGVKFKAPVKVDFIFHEMTDNKGHRYVGNAALGKHMFDSSPSPVFYVESPNYIRNMRTLVKMGLVAMNFIPGVPGIIKQSVERFSQSWYQEQQKLEAFLVAHYEANGQSVMAQRMVTQISNPFFNFNL
jgi:hypothetical protein